MLLSITDLSAFNSLTWDGTLGRPRLPKGDNGDDPMNPITYHSSAGLVVQETAAEVGSPNDGLEQPLLPAEGARRWFKGIILALVAGALYSVMYIPLLWWKARMLAQDIHPDGYDSFFSMAVGLYSSSTLWLMGKGAIFAYRRQRMEKSVLRPALISGIIYGIACICFLIAMVRLPYAVGYALGIGGGLAVSLLWATLVFKEANSRHNRRCVALSFTGVLIGITLLGCAA